MKNLATQYIYLNSTYTYNGEQLKPHWALTQTNCYGSVVVGFSGPCKVATSDLVDYEDRLNNDFIAAQKMFHLIGEFFNINLTQGIFIQRLLIQHLFEQCISLDKKLVFERSGDDLFVYKKKNKYKMTVSIATASAVSVLIHWGINLVAKGAPVAAIGFSDLGFTEKESKKIIENAVNNFCLELNSIDQAFCKVMPRIA